MANKEVSAVFDSHALSHFSDLLVWDNTQDGTAMATHHQNHGRLKLASKLPEQPDHLPLLQLGLAV
jgi:nitrate reductase assembly molybdenum cofactor insertion protein NarJ